MQKDFKVVIDTEARADIKSIHAYYLMQSLSYEVADMVTDKIFGTAYGLAFMHNPILYRPVHPHRACHPRVPRQI